MNRERAKELLPIIQAFGDGVDIQKKSRKESPEHPAYWETIVNESFFIDNLKPAEYEYRIKPQPREFWINTMDNTVHDTDGVSGALLDSRWVRVREIIE